MMEPTISRDDIVCVKLTDLGMKRFRERFTANDHRHDGDVRQAIDILFVRDGQFVIPYGQLIANLPEAANGDPSLVESAIFPLTRIEVTLVSGH